MFGIFRFIKLFSPFVFLSDHSLKLSWCLCDLYDSYEVSFSTNPVLNQANLSNMKQTHGNFKYLLVIWTKVDGYLKAQYRVIFSNFFNVFITLN